MHNTSAASKRRMRWLLRIRAIVFSLTRAAFAGVGTRVVPIALPDEFLAAGALPTLHDRYGLSTDAVVARVKSEL